MTTSVPAGTFRGFTANDRCNTFRTPKVMADDDATAADIVATGTVPDEQVLNGVPVYVTQVDATDYGWMSDQDSAVDTYLCTLPRGVDIAVDDRLRTVSDGRDYVVTTVNRVRVGLPMFALTHVQLRLGTDPTA